MARERAIRPSSKPILALVSRFKPSTGAAEGTSVNHRHAVVEEIEDDAGLGRVVEPCPLEKLSRHQAENLLRESSARAVVYGKIRVEGDAYLVKGAISLLPPDSAPAGSSQSGPAPPPRHILLGDPGRPLVELVGDHRKASHFGVIRAELLRLAASLDA